MYYLRRPSPEEPEVVRRDLAWGATERIRPLPRLLYKSGLWVAPDESEMLFAEVGAAEADLMLIDSMTHR